MLLLTLLLLTPQDAPFWPKVSSRPTAFAAEFPTQPKRQTLKDTGPDDKDVSITMYRANVEGRSYLVTISAFSDDYMKQPVEKIFDNARDGSVSRSGGTLVSERNFKIGN